MEIYEGLEDNVKNAKIKVIGVGGGGNNAVNRMIEDGITDIEYISLNTDYNVLAKNNAPKKIQLGLKLTKGLGAGGFAEIGRKSAEETKNEIEEAIDGADLVFITAGMGGGTGTGAAPVIAEIAKSKGILTIGVVTTPFSFEGERRMENALSGVANLKKVVDSLVVIPNEKLMYLSDENLTVKNAFKKADDVLVQGVRGIYDIINETSDINVDFADVCTITRDKGIAHMGVGTGAGKNKAEIAVKMAINSPLLETSITGAKSVLINFTSDEGLGLVELKEAVDIIRASVYTGANIIFGCTYRPDLEDFVAVTVIATDLDDNDVKYNDLSTSNDEFIEQPQNNEQSYINDQNTGRFNTMQFDSTSQINTVNYNTSPNIQPVNYDSERQSQNPTPPRTSRYKINHMFTQSSSNLPDID